LLTLIHPPSLLTSIPTTPSPPLHLHSHPVSNPPNNHTRLALHITHNVFQRRRVVKLVRYDYKVCFWVDRLEGVGEKVLARAGGVGGAMEEARVGGGLEEEVGGGVGEGGGCVGERCYKHKKGV